MIVQVKIAANGRICIPADVRARLGLKDGDSLLLDETEEGLVLRTYDQAIRQAQAITRRLREGKPDVTVDDFISEKHRDARREEERFIERYGRDGS